MHKIRNMKKMEIRETMNTQEEDADDDNEDEHGWYENGEEQTRKIDVCPSKNTPSYCEDNLSYLVIVYPSPAGMKSRVCQGRPS